MPKNPTPLTSNPDFVEFLEALDAILGGPYYSCECVPNGQPGDKHPVFNSVEWTTLREFLPEERDGFKARILNKDCKDVQLLLDADFIVTHETEHMILLERK